MSNIKPIPVIGTVVVNCPFWVSRLIMSVDYPVDEFVIFNNNGRGEIDDELNKLTTLSHRFIKKIKVCHLPSNIGCASAWNLIIKSYVNAPYWIIVNNDVAFSPNLLKELVNNSEDPEVGLVFGKAGVHHVGNWDLFLIKDITVQRYGIFDENLYPAYGEDVDYIMRLEIDTSLKKVFLENYDYLHGESFDYGQTGSQTWRSEPDLKLKIDSARQMNEYEYLNYKWGEGWRWLSPTCTPFNKPDLPLSYTTYDIEFIRKKYIGF